MLPGGTARIKKVPIITFLRVNLSVTQPAIGEIKKPANTLIAKKVPTMLSELVCSNTY